MWIDPKTNWTSKDVPLPGDFNRIEGNVKELKEGVDGLAVEVDAIQAGGIPKITFIESIPTSIVVAAGNTVSQPLQSSSGHCFYLISIYSPTETVAETAAELPGFVTWHLRQGKTGAKDTILITNQSSSAVTIYIKAAYIS